MSHILTAIYATEGGDAPARYAAGLAVALNLPLRIVYPFIVPVAIGEIPMPLMPVDGLQDAAKARLDAIAAEITSQHPALSVSAKVTYGILADMLDDDESAPPMLTVIGNDESGDTDTRLGGNSAEILREGSLPVLAVPQSASFRRPLEVCFACDGRGIREGLPVAALLALKEQLGFRLTMLHVAGASEEEATSYEGSKLQAQLSGIFAGYAQISAAGAVDEAISTFADSHNIDWLALAPHHYGFWESIFRSSHTRRLLHLAHMPVLALHGA